MQAHGQLPDARELLLPLSLSSATDLQSLLRLADVSQLELRQALDSHFHVRCTNGKSLPEADSEVQEALAALMMSGGLPTSISR